ncbi:membrane-associated protein, putative, partial [Bodo saltans]
MTISVRTFLAIVTAVVGISAAAIAFAPVYTSALSSVEDVVESLREEIGARLQVNVEQYFAAPQLRVTSLMTSAKLGAMNTSDKYTMMPYMGEIALSSGITVTAGFEDGTYLSVNPNSQPPNALNVFYSHGVAASQGYRFQYNMTTRTNTSSPPIITVNTYNPTVRPWYPVVVAAQSWSTVYLDSSGNFSVLTVGGPFTNDTGLKFGGFAMDFSTALILSYLGGQRVGKTGRVFLMDRVTNGFLGGDWAVSSVVNNSGTLQMAQVADVASSDPLVSKMYGHLGLEFIKNCTAPCRADIGSGNGALFVDVLAITDSYGLDMRLVVLLPAKDFMDKIDHDSKVSIAATAVAIAVLLFFSVGVGQLALSPLSHLESRLYAAASLVETSDESEVCDFLTEVVSIEGAFTVLREELTRIKSFVPQSVLQTIEERDNEEECAPLVLHLEGSICLSESQRQPHQQHRANDGLVLTASQSELHSKSRSSEGALKKSATMIVLNMNTGLASRQVTLLVANVIGFHDVSAISPGACLTFHERYLNIICAASSKNRGVVDHFSGDRVFISFNASNNVATHVTRCAATICAIEDSVRKLSAKDAMTVRLGAATGRVLAGNMGNNTIKRFSMVGRTVNQSMVLLQLAKMWNVPNVVSSATMETMEFEYNVEAVGIAVLPGSEKGGKRMVVGSVLGAKA